MFYDSLDEILGNPTPYGRFIYIDAIPPHTPTTYRANMITNPYITNKLSTNNLPTTTNIDRSSPDNQASSQVTPPFNTPHPGSPDNVPLLTQAPEPFPLPTNNATDIDLHDILLREPLVQSAASSPGHVHAAAGAYRGKSGHALPHGPGRLLPEPRDLHGN